MEVSSMSADDIKKAQEEIAQVLGMSLGDYLAAYHAGELGRFGEPADHSRGLRHDMSDPAVRRRFLRRSSGL